jgi:phage terminase large subunit-like protein
MFLRNLRHEHLVERYHELRYADDPDQPKVFSRHMRVLSADANRLQGLEPTVCFVDELHAHRDDSVFLAQRTAVIKKPGSKLVTISTAGAAADSPLGKLRARCLALPSVSRKGVVTEASGPALTMLEWSLEDSDDYTDPAVVKKVNPASRITADDLAEQQGAGLLIA